MPLPTIRRLCRYKDDVKHFHIKYEEGAYRISSRHSFPTIEKLVEYHKHNADGKPWTDI